MRKISISILLIAITLFTYGQDTLGFTTTLYSLPNITLGDTTTIVDTMYNTGPAVLNGPVTFGAYLNDSITLDSTVFSSSPVIGASDTISSGSRKKMTFHLVNSSPPFEVGPNTVVIWPIYFSNFNPIALGYVGPYDSIRVTTYYYPLGIAESPLAKMYIYEVPGRLNINFGDAENSVKQVRIYNVLGQNVYTNTPDKSTNIPTAGWSTGIYLCEIMTFSGETRTFKFRVE